LIGSFESYIFDVALNAGGQISGSSGAIGVGLGSGFGACPLHFTQHPLSFNLFVINQEASKKVKNIIAGTINTPKLICSPKK
jgi:hypothetical protein